MRTKKIKDYDIEFKQSSVKLALGSDRTIAETARSLGINENTLYGWIKKYKGRSPKTVGTSELEKLQQEVAQLRKENNRLKQERDILKKATAYFASGTM